MRLFLHPNLSMNEEPIESYDTTPSSNFELQCKQKSSTLSKLQCLIMCADYPYFSNRTQQQHVLKRFPPRIPHHEYWQHPTQSEETSSFEHVPPHHP